MTTRTKTTTDYYAVLGITPTAPLADIKRAYRKLARAHHPDINPGNNDAARRFRLITEAYDMLSDTNRRKAYDATRSPAAGPLATPGTSPVVSALLAVLEDAWAAIRAHHPQIPPAVIIIASGSSGRQRLYGYHDPARWHVAEGDRAEIMVSGEGLARDPADVLGTLLHEATHALAAARGIQDTSRQGRYHNKRFKILADELGISTEHDDRIGWSITTVPDETAKRYAAQITALAEAMTLWRHADQHTTRGGGTGRSTNLLAACCPCGRSIRIAPSTLAVAPVVCLGCGGKFEPKEPR